MALDIPYPLLQDLTYTGADQTIMERLEFEMWVFGIKTGDNKITFNGEIHFHLSGYFNKKIVESGAVKILKKRVKI